MSAKRILVVGIIVVALLSVLLILLIPERREARAPRAERVVVIPLKGPIESGGSSFAFTSNITPEYVSRQLDRAAGDPEIKAVVLRIDSPGGAVAASQEIANMIANYEKPVVVSMGDMAASGGYYISAPADGIVASPGTMTGSMGVIMTTFNPEGLYEKLGIEVEIIKSGEHKDLYQRTLEPEERQLLQEMSDKIHEQFIEDVAAGRGLDREKVRELATGRLFIGSQALEYGLVDRLGGLDAAVEYAADLAGLEEPKKYRFPDPSFLDLFREYSLHMPAMLEKIFLPAEYILLEKFGHRHHPEFRYE